jgi:hypothetical protein
MKIDEQHISNVQAELKKAASLLAPSLLAEQDVSVAFDIAAAASTKFTAFELGEQFMTSVNDGGATFTTLSSESGIDIQAEVLGVKTSARAAGVPAPAAAERLGAGAIAAISIGSVVLCCCLVGVVWHIKAAKGKESSSSISDGNQEVQMQENAVSAATSVGVDGWVHTDPSFAAWPAELMQSLASTLLAEGYCTTNNVADLNAAEVEEIIKTTDMKNGFSKTFKKAVTELKLRVH